MGHHNWLYSIWWFASYGTSSWSRGYDENQKQNSLLSSFIIEDDHRQLQTLKSTATKHTLITVRIVHNTASLCCDCRLQWSFVKVVLECPSITHWGRVTHICVSDISIIVSDNGLSPGQRQAIIWTNAGKLLTRPLGTNLSELLIEIYTFSFKKMHLKISSGNGGHLSRPQCVKMDGCGPIVVLSWWPILFDHW